MVNVVNHAFELRDVNCACKVYDTAVFVRQSVMLLDYV